MCPDGSFNVNDITATTRDIHKNEKRYIRSHLYHWDHFLLEGLPVNRVHNRALKLIASACSYLMSRCLGVSQGSDPSLNFLCSQCKNSQADRLRKQREFMIYNQFE